MVIPFCDEWWTFPPRDPLEEGVNLDIICRILLASQPLFVAGQL